MCSVVGCQTEKTVAKGYCWKHYRRFLRTGTTELKPKPKLYRPAIQTKTATLLPLGPYLDGHPKYGYTIISPEDLWTEQYLWTLNNGYAVANIDGKITTLHQLIKGKPTGQKTEIDHINRDRLDNRRTNLRHCTRTLNQLNNNIRTTNTSGHTGVCWNKRDKKWMTSISYKKHKIYLGSYNNIEQATKRRKEAHQALLTAIQDETIDSIPNIKEWLQNESYK